MSLNWGMFFGLLGALALECLGFGQTQEYTARIDLKLPSASRSGNALDDTIHFNYYRPVVLGATPSPAIIAIDGLDFIGVRGTINPITDPFARYAASNGVPCVSISLPYEMMRQSPGDKPVKHYLSLDPKVSAQAFEQAVSDVETVADWLRSQPGIDPKNVGLVGVSLGSIVVHLVMGEDSTFKGGVTVLNMGDFPDYYVRGPLLQISRSLHWGSPTSDRDVAKDYAFVDPLTYAKNNQPRRVLMIQAARDMVFPPHYGVELWKALGKPPLRWVDTNHLGLGLVQDQLNEVALNYLAAVWHDPYYDGSHFPQLWAPTIKLGFIAEWKAMPALALQYQFLTLGRLPNHLPIFNANVGVGTNGAFANVAVTLGQHVDFGWIQHLPVGRAGPYLSFHVTF